MQTVVLANGEVIKTRRRAHKSSAGIDMTKLFIGGQLAAPSRSNDDQPHGIRTAAEGTLGIVTEGQLGQPFLAISLRHVRSDDPFGASGPDARRGSAIQGRRTRGLRGPRNSAQPVQHEHPYASLSLAACRTQVDLECVELADEDMMKAINESGEVPGRKFAVKDSLFIKIQGSESAIAEAASDVKRIVEKHGASGWDFGSSDEDAKDLWNARKAGLWSALAGLPKSRAWTTDVWCVCERRRPGGDLLTLA